MCCSDLSVKGGMVSVVKNYLEYAGWEEFDINFVPTHIEKSKPVVALYFLKAYIKILWLALTKKIDVAYLHTSERGSVYRKILIMRTLKRFGIKTVLHHHGAEFEEFYKGLSQKKKEYVSKNLELADINIVLSERLIGMIKSKAPNARVEVLYNSVPVDGNRYNAEGRSVLFLGRLGERKGAYDLLEAIKRADAQIDGNVRFLLCGDGEVENVRERAEEMGIMHRIGHIGWIDKAQKNEFYKDVIINVLPSYNEGLPMTILETMAYGIPNISTPVASIPEVVKDMENGMLVEPGDVEALTEKLVSLINDADMRKRFSEKAYEKINESFSVDSNMEKLKTMLRNL